MRHLIIDAKGKKGGTVFKKILAAKITIVLVVVLTLSSFTVQAGIPVFDGVANVTRIMQIIEAIAQTLKQIEEYKTQLQQYQNMLQNTMRPARFVWDDAQGTMRNLLNAIDTLEYYKRKVGSLNQYLEKYHDIDYYKNSPCFTDMGCSDAEREILLKSRSLGSESQKKTNDAVFRGLDYQQDALERDASKLRDLQSAAQGASGQVEAIGYANQLASSQTHQLLQIRGLLIAQQNALVARNQALADREAQEEASSQEFRKGNYQQSSGKQW